MQVNVQQNTTEWFLTRRGPKGIRVGGSEAGTICGVSGNALPFSLYDKIIGELEGTWPQNEEEPEACKHGHRCEPLISDLYTAFTGYVVEEANYWKHIDPKLEDLYGCSPDRKVYINGKFEGLLEIKAPYHVMYKKIKPEHICQMQYQMWITQKPWCDYMAVKLDHDQPENKNNESQSLLKRVYYSKDYVEKWMKPRLFYFSECLINRTPPPRELYRTKQTQNPPVVKSEILLS